ncbi:hypothetical protein PG997_010019 [Apiospora hydei]|uniref:F-box domain-containing protein n=1 Tax=Apiospora hydei TaxID=1337664 RepID=A0ABR1VVT5_9PEZI
MSSPQLPLELWTRIISHVTDCRYLPRVWLNCRLVSHTFKAATEAAFIAKHLPHTRIEFAVPLEKWGLLDNNGKKIEDDSIFMKFSHLAEDGERAVFVREKPDEELSTQLSSDRFIEYWRQALSGHLENPTVSVNYPVHTVYVRREVNDTVLPSPQIDIGKVEASFLWKPMLSMLYGEAEYTKWAQKVETQHNTAQHEHAVRLAARVQAGDETALEEFMQFAVNTVSQNVDKVQDEVRRQRLLRWHRKNGSLENPDVKVILSQPLKRPSLNQARDVMQEVDFADEIEGERSEKGMGNFYDGLGYTFLGNTETGPDVDDSDDES